MKRRSKQPQFGEKGLKQIEYLGDTPAAFGPFLTLKIYRFRPGKNPRAVDVRDLTLLAKAAGRANLRDVDEPQQPEPKRARKPKQEEIQEEIIEGVKDDGIE